MFLFVQNSEAERLLPIYMLTVGADFVQPPVRRPKGAPLHQIFFVDRGRVRFRACGEEVVLTEGSVVFMKKGMPVSYECTDGEGRTGWIAFDGGGVEGVLDYFHAAPFSHQSGAPVRELRRACIRAAERKAPAEMLSGLAYDLLLSYFRALQARSESSELTLAKTYVGQHFATDLAVADVARAAGISESLLYRLFRREGTTPVGYLRDVRLQHAKRLLLEAPDLTVAEIAARCGFISAAYFCKVFRVAEHTTPKKYRDAYLA
jgi:AraC-like DNA-binding protein